MFNSFELMLAKRYLVSGRRDKFTSLITIFSLLGIMLGVATLIIVMSVMGGFRAELMGKILGLNGHIGIYSKNNESLHNFDKISEDIKKINGVISVTPIIEGQVLITNGPGTALGGMVKGIRQEDLIQKSIIANNIKAGSLNNFNEENNVAIGSRLAVKLGLNIGSHITLISPQGKTSVIGTAPRLRAFKVSAIFEVGMNEYDSSFVYMPLNAAQMYFQNEYVSQIEVFVKDPTDVTKISNMIKESITDPIKIINWQEANNSFAQALKIERNVMFIILTLIIIVAAFNIISSLIMLVKDKRRDIAVLRTMGATRGNILRVFLMCGASIGILGTILGVTTGVLFSLNIENIRQGIQILIGTELLSDEIYFLTKLPSVLNFYEVIKVIIMSLSISIIATIYPAWRAANTDPVKTFRNE